MHSAVDEEAGGFGAIDALKRDHLAKAAVATEASSGDINVCAGGVEWIRITLTGRGHAATATRIFGRCATGLIGWGQS